MTYNYQKEIDDKIIDFNDLYREWMSIDLDLPKNKPYYFIYETKNLITNKSYI